MAVEAIAGDKAPDLVTPTGTSANVSAARNQGSGTFGKAATRATDKGPASPALADLDGDGDLDLAVANEAGTLSLLFNKAGKFAPAQNIKMGTRPFYVRAGDMDLDKDLDLAVVMEGEDRVVVMNNDGKGALTRGKSYPTGKEPSAMVLGDLDGDKDLDIVVTNYKDGSLSVILNRAVP